MWGTAISEEYEEPSMWGSEPFISERSSKVVKNEADHILRHSVVN